MNSAAIRRDAERLKTFGRDKWCRFFNPLAAKSAHNDGVLLDCIAELNDRVRMLEGDLRDPDEIDGVGP